MRHAEEPDLSRGFLGVGDHGERDGQALSVRGWQRAGALVALLRDADAGPGPLRTPRAIFAATDVGKSKRPQLTVQPVAAALGLKVDTRFGSEGDPQLLVRVAQASAGPVLVSWRHEHLPSLAATIAGDGVAPGEWPHGRYDRLWLLQRDGEGQPWRFADVPQRLLAGDADA